MNRETAQRNGRRRQADWPTLTYKTEGRTAITAPEIQLRRSLELVDHHSRTGQSELANELESTRAKLAARTSALTRAEQRITLLAKRVTQLEELRGRGASPSSVPKGHLKTACEQLPDADKWASVLEDELSAVREELVLRENENLSLRASLDLFVGENARLTNSLSESDALIKSASSQLETTETTVRQLEAECKKLAAAAIKADERRQAETNELRFKLEDMSSRAVKDKLLAEVWQSMLARNEKNSLSVGEVLRLFRHLAERDVAADLARSQLDAAKHMLTRTEIEREELAVVVADCQTEISALTARLGAMSSRAVAAENLLASARISLLEKLELLQSLLQAKDEEVRLLKQSRLKMVEETNTLLLAADKRETALTDADKRVDTLNARMSGLETDRLSICQERNAELESGISHNSALEGQNQGFSTVTLLAETITFESPRLIRSL